MLRSHGDFYDPHFLTASAKTPLELSNMWVVLTMSEFYTIFLKNNRKNYAKWWIKWWLKTWMI